MNKYEILYILVNELEDEQKNALVERFSTLVTSFGGTVESIDKWGAIEYKYPIENKKFGYYVLMNFSAEPTFPLELERQMKITDGVVRYMVVRRPIAKKKA